MVPSFFLAASGVSLKCSNMSEGSTMKSATSEPSIDHRRHIEMPLMYNQGKCNCCWAVATSGSIECAFKIEYNIPSMHLSPQQLLDCNLPDEGVSYDSCGCYPHKLGKAFQYVCEFGLREESVYPFVGRKGLCRDFNSGEKCFKIATYKFLKKGDEASLIKIVQHQPIAAGVRFTEDLGKLKDEIYMGPEPGQKEFKHAILIVGCDTQICNGVATNYWLIKNSWGTDWGVNGYGKICRDSSLPKGMETLIIRPIVPILHPKEDSCC